MWYPFLKHWWRSEIIKDSIWTFKISMGVLRHFFAFIEKSPVEHDVGRWYVQRNRSWEGGNFWPGFNLIKNKIKTWELVRPGFWLKNNTKLFWFEKVQSVIKLIKLIKFINKKRFPICVVTCFAISFYSITWTQNRLKKKLEKFT